MSYKRKTTKFVTLGRADEVIVEFPGGAVQVTRRPDGEGYWAHITIDRADRNPQAYGKAPNVRIDCEGMNTRDASIGDMARPDLYHVAVCIKEVRK